MIGTIFAEGTFGLSCQKQQDGTTESAVTDKPNGNHRKGGAVTIKKHITAKTRWLMLAAIAGLTGFFLVIGSSGEAMDAKAKKKRIEHVKAFQAYQKRCLGCHDSVADPEKPGRTRDDWHTVINVMHGYGFDMTAEEGEAITDLLYDLRKGMEKDAG